MISSMGTFARYYLYFMLILLTWAFCVLAYWEIDNLFSTSTTSSEEHILGLSTVPVGADVVVEYTIKRNRSCKLEITRILKRVNATEPLNREEFQVGMVTRDFEEDPMPFVTSYIATIPKNAKSGQYELFTRIRYYCNGLDYLFPRFLTTSSVYLTVI